MRNINTQLKKNALKLIISLSITFFLFVSANDASAGMRPSEVIQLVNEARLQNGLPVLSQDPVLMKAAQEKAADMTTLQYFAHVSPNGVSPWYWFEKNNYDYQYAGENLAINFTSATEQQKAWMQSESHRKNILNKNYKDTGVAIREGYINGKPAIVTVQLFGTQAGEKVVAIAEVKGMVTAQTQPISVLDQPMVILGSVYVWIMMIVVLVVAIGMDVYIIVKKHHHDPLITAH